MNKFKLKDKVNAVCTVGLKTATKTGKIIEILCDGEGYVIKDENDKLEHILYEKELSLVKVKNKK